ncbi:hypothetical protein [Gracilimonas sediminicola]|uniref:hypothetical protein n=1 Tax=Gracilimonas sediminicola TaxID=2952158 RepID=UPI0038D3A710
MKAFFETTLGKVILAAVVIGIWGVNVVNFSEMAGSDEPEQARIYADVMDEQLALPDFIPYRYQPGGRNPFQLPGNMVEPQARPSPQAEQEEYAPPSVVLSGVMEGMAIIRDQAGQTFFVEENDSFNNITVKAIFSDSVHLEHQGRTFTVNLNEM